MTRQPRPRPAFTLIELLVVVGVLAVIMAILLAILSRGRKASVAAKLRSQYETSEVVGHDRAAPAAAMSPPVTQPGLPPPPPTPAAHVSSFDADVALTPRLSVGTADPESIYEAKLTAKMTAGAGSPSAGTNDKSEPAVRRIELPLPPQIISLADLSVTVDGKPSDAVEVRGDRLVWEGPVKGGAGSAVDVTYTAFGRGLYALQTPPGKILDTFKIKLTATGTDVRMLDLSMQPTSPILREGDKTTYVWDYKRLLFGRPIAMDVLGIAPPDRLGELGWLGPLSVVAFGIVVGLVARAASAERFDRWVLMLVLGTFAAAYPLMYFAQEFVPLPTAVAAAAGVVLAVIGWRAVTIMGARAGLAGVAVPAAVIMATALAAALNPGLQGLLLTAIILAVFVLAMVLAPRLKRLPAAQAPAAA